MSSAHSYLPTYLNSHSLIRGVLIQSWSAGAKNYTNYVFCHPQFSGVIQNIENHCAIVTLFRHVDYYQNNQFYIIKIEFLKFGFIGTIIFGALAWTIELYMKKYIICEIFSSGGATLYRNPSDQTVSYISKIEKCSSLLQRNNNIGSFANLLPSCWGQKKNHHHT